jgi:hypothetical protein
MCPSMHVDHHRLPHHHHTNRLVHSVTCCAASARGVACGRPSAPAHIHSTNGRPSSVAGIVVQPPRAHSSTCIKNPKRSVCSASCSIRPTSPRTRPCTPRIIISAHHARERGFHPLDPFTCVHIHDLSI